MIIKKAKYKNVTVKQRRMVSEEVYGCDECEKENPGKKAYGSDDLAIEVGEYTQISQSDFESDIEKVIKGK